MALPKRRHSIARRNKRRSHHHLELPTLVTCPQCKTAIRTHNACHKCGYYNGRKVDHTIKEETKKKRARES